MSDVVLVTFYGLITALCTGLGAIPFYFISDLSPRLASTTSAIAAGLMLGASFGLLKEGSDFGLFQTIAGGGAGLLFVLASERYLSKHKNFSLGNLKGASARQALLVLVVMTVHSFSEGVAVGVSFGGGEDLGLMITIAIAVHNIPEGLAISAALRPRGTSVAACAGWSIFSSLPQPLMAAPCFLFVEWAKPLLPYGLGFAAGAMVLVVFMELLPEAYEKGRRSDIALIVCASIGLMILFQHYL